MGNNQDEKSQECGDISIGKEDVAKERDLAEKRDLWNDKGILEGNDRVTKDDPGCKHRECRGKHIQRLPGDDLIGVEIDGRKGM